MSGGSSSEDHHIFLLTKLILQQHFLGRIRADIGGFIIGTHESRLPATVTARL